MKHKFNKKKLFKLIDNSEVVSFDIFDTLLLRPYKTPSDLFLHMEIEYNLTNFSKKRAEAEQQARETLITNKKQDVSIDEIYRFIEEPLRKYKDIETKWELDCLTQNKELYCAYQYALEKGKQIYIISDMYLPKKTLINALSKNGYTAFDKLYVSCEKGLTKHTSDLFKLVIQENNLKANKVLHIGDNELSDIKAPNKLKINSYYYPQVIKRYLGKNKRVNKLNQQSESFDKQTKLDLSILMMTDAINKLNNSYKSFWGDMGYTFAGPMVYSFTKWIEQSALERNIENISFIARDGFFLNKVMKIINPDINSHYIYASRKVISSIKKDKQLFDSYNTYLASINMLNNKTAMVDVGTCNFTTQNFLTGFNQNIHSFYWVTGNEDSKLNYSKFYDYSFKLDSKFMQTGLIELFMTSPEAPVDGMKNDLSIIFKELNKEEKYRSFILNEMNQPITDFAYNMKKYYNNKKILLSPKAIILWNNLWLLEPTNQEYIESKKIKHASDQNHTQYVEILKLKKPNILRKLLKKGK